MKSAAARPQFGPSPRPYTGRTAASSCLRDGPQTCPRSCPCPRCAAADRRFEWARESLAQGDVAGAADLFEQTLDLVPGYAAGWFLLGEARDKLGDRAGAIAIIAARHIG